MEIQIFSLSVDPNILTVCGSKYSHCLWFQIFSLPVVPNILTVCGSKYSHCLWFQIFSLSVVPNILIVCGPFLRTVGTKLGMKGTWAHRDTESTRCTGMKGTLGTAQLIARCTIGTLELREYSRTSEQQPCMGTNPLAFVESLTLFRSFLD